MLKALVIGHLGKDCVVNTVNGKNVINFTVAHSEKFKDSQGVNQERTTWVDCAYWTDRTAIAPYLVKGIQVYVEGTPEVKTFTRNDGTAGASFALRVAKIELLGGNKNSNQSNGQYSGGANTSAPSGTAGQQNIQDEVSDDLPF